MKESQALSERTQHRWGMGTACRYLGEAHRLAGDRLEARTILLDGLRLAHDIHSSPLMLDALLGLAGLDAQAGDVEMARQLADCVARHAASTTEARAAWLCADAEARLTPEQFEALQSRASTAHFSRWCSSYRTALDSCARRPLAIGRPP